MHIFFKIAIYFVCVFRVTCSFAGQADTAIHKQYQNALALMSNSPDSCLSEIGKCIPEMERIHDTLTLVDAHMNLLQAHTKQGNYSEAYNDMWHILPLVESAKFINEKVNALDKLIGLHMVLERYEKAKYALHEMDSLISLLKEDSELKKLSLGRVYLLGSWIEQKYTQDYKKAKKLTIKGMMQYEGSTSNPSAYYYALLQLANVNLLMGNPDSVVPVLNKVFEAYPLPLKSIHSLLFDRYGQYYTLVHKNDSAIYYYSLCLQSMDEFQNHIDRKLSVLYNLAKLHEEKGNIALSLRYLKEADRLNNELFSSTKSQNKQLFEISNKYEEQLAQIEIQLQEQRLSSLVKENQLMHLKAFILVFASIIIIIFIVLFLKRKAKHAILERELELKNKEKSLELKNKELLSSALQLLERDTWQLEVKQQLNKLTVHGENATIVQELKGSLQLDTKHKWTEFETRFTAVNDQFFVALKKAYPALTPTDLKMCAFIKLGFSSKDMAQIMGITSEGINTSRSRLRKKLNLTREIILSEFLQDYQSINF